MWHNILCLIAVGILWGATNPLIRRGSIGVDKIIATNPIKQFFAELYFLVTRWQYLIPFLLNQSGSILYMITLQGTNLSLAVPVANSFTFVFTAISSILLGEQRSSMKTYFGMALIIAGTTLCVYDSSLRVNNNN